ncbi:MAG: DUF6029 family protein [Bacteroidaceae bacterium]|nr:DUF6029 family protein [Bacteroidaceae bacterium]
MKKNFLLLSSLIIFASNSKAQDLLGKYMKSVTLNGSIQSDMLVPTCSQDDGSNEDFRTNTYADLNMMSKYVDAGLRFAYLQHPMPGYEKDFKGYGIPYFYVNGKLDDIEITAGNIYDQFGSGFIFRTYEERSIGVDNSLLGGRIMFTPAQGIRTKVLTGKQRRYWDYNDSWITGADVEFDLSEWIRPLENNGTTLSLGASFVNKYEGKNSGEDIYRDPTHKLNFPEYVNSWDARMNLSKGGFNVLAEYAQKTQDPSFDNGYIYRKGYAAMLSMSYSKKGMSFLAQAKRADNMSSRSCRTTNGQSSFISYMPAFSYEHTYTLAASYPYASQLDDGEWAYQAQAGYTFKRRTALGGKYGTTVKVNFSHIHSIDKNWHNLPGSTDESNYKGSNGFGSSFWKWGDQTYYQDLNVQIEKKLSRDFDFTLMYMNEFYNQAIVEGEGSMIHCDIFVAECKYKFSPKTILRTEFQYLTTEEDEGDSMFGLVELSLAPHWMFSVSDEFNVGLTNNHYWNVLATYNIDSHRVQFGYMKTSDGYNCAGGVCRFVPSYEGLCLSYNYNF